MQTEEQLSRHKSVSTHCILLLSRLCALVRGEPQSTQKVRCEGISHVLEIPRADTAGPPDFLQLQMEGSGKEKTKQKSKV